MIILGGREDVVAQWISKDFIIRYSGFFKEMVIGPGEYAVIIKNGKIVDVVTQEKLKGLSGGFLQVIKNWLGGGEDLQVLIVDVRPKRIAIGFRGFTKDRVEVAGTANILLRISPKHAPNIINLMYGPTKLKIPHRWFYNREKGLKKGLKNIFKGRPDKANKEIEDLKAQDMITPEIEEEYERSKTEYIFETEDKEKEITLVEESESYSLEMEGAWVKELTVSDIQQKLQEELNAAIQANVLILHDSKDFHENMREVLEDSKNVIESLKPLWNSFGIDVITATFSFDKNAYEELQIKLRELELKRMQDDLEFMKEIGDEKREKERKKEIAKIEYDWELFKKFKDFDSKRVDKGIQYELEKIDEEYNFGLEDLKRKFEQELDYNVLRRELDFETEMSTKKQTLEHELESRELEHNRSEAIKDMEVENTIKNIGIIGETERQKIVARAEAYRRQIEASIGHYEEMKKLDIEKHKLGVEREKLEMEQDMEDREVQRDMNVLREMAQVKKELKEVELKEKLVDREYEVKKTAITADVEKTKAIAESEARKAEAIAKAEKLKADEIISKYEQALDGQRKHEIEKEKLEIEKVKAMSGLVKEPSVLVVGKEGHNKEEKEKHTKVCPYCGRVIPASALYCPYCGKKVE